MPCGHVPSEGARLRPQTPTCHSPPPSSQGEQLGPFAAHLEQAPVRAHKVHVHVHLFVVVVARRHEVLRGEELDDEVPRGPPVREVEGYERHRAHVRDGLQLHAEGEGAHQRRGPGGRVRRGKLGEEAWPMVRAPHDAADVLLHEPPRPLRAGDHVRGDAPQGAVALEHRARAHLVHCGEHSEVARRARAHHCLAEGEALHHGDGLPWQECRGHAGVHEARAVAHRLAHDARGLSARAAPRDAVRLNLRADAPDLEHVLPLLDGGAKAVEEQVEVHLRGREEGVVQDDRRLAREAAEALHGHAPDSVCDHAETVEHVRAPRALLVLRVEVVEARELTHAGHRVHARVRAVHEPRHRVEHGVHPAREEPVVEVGLSDVHVTVRGVDAAVREHAVEGEAPRLAAPGGLQVQPRLHPGGHVDAQRARRHRAPERRLGAAGGTQRGACLECAAEVGHGQGAQDGLDELGGQTGEPDDLVCLAGAVAVGCRC
mmetsp:Transcript_21367/g.71879  ORF Transcript_21367/g.71879 Transcript_21367/m.71879 type:complete len:487 (+) Transcript_21367:412-1872(+)